MLEFKIWLQESSEENAKTVQAAFQRGVDRNDPSALGFHGTSLQTLKKALRTGFLPVTKGTEGVYGGDRYGPGKDAYGLHIVPNPNNATVRNIQFRREREIDPLEDAANWAKHTANRHHMFDKHGLDMNDPEHHKIAFLVQQGEAPESSLKLPGRTPNPKPIKGAVVLSISEDAARDFKTSVGGDGDDLNIQTEALPLRYIRGIEPHDQESYDWLDALGSSDASGA